MQQKPFMVYPILRTLKAESIDKVIELYHESIEEIIAAESENQKKNLGVHSWGIHEEESLQGNTRFTMVIALIEYNEEMIKSAEEMQEQTMEMLKKMGPGVMERIAELNKEGDPNCEHDYAHNTGGHLVCTKCGHQIT